MYHVLCLAASLSPVAEFLDKYARYCLIASFAKGSLLQADINRARLRQQRQA